MSHQTNHLYEFGPFRLDSRERVLLRDGMGIPLAPKSFDLLLAMVEHHGHLLEKEELMKLVWPDVFVEETNLSSNVSLLRKALGDGENGQRYIETVPRRGYRFVAGVREVKPALLERVEAAPLGPAVEARQEPKTAKGKLLRKTILQRLTVVVILLAGLALGVYKYVSRFQSKSSGPEPKVLMVTSLPGSERQPAFSPDGERIAFVGDGEAEDNPDIYVKMIDAGEPLRLTTNPAPDLNPVWSPDGRHIAFVREGKGSGVYLVPVLGGAERKLTGLFEERPFYKLSLMYSPDGKFLAVADKSAEAEPYHILLLTIGTGEREQLTFPPAGSVGDDSPAFAPDGRTVAFTRTLGQGARDIYAVPVNGGSPRRLTFDATWIEGLSWTSEGDEIVYSTNRGGNVLPYLWRTPSDGGASKPIEMFAQYLIHPAISRQGNRMAWTQSFQDVNIWRIEISGDGRQTAAPVRLIASTKYDAGPRYSLDGQRIVFSSVRTGNSEIWVSDRNGDNQMQLTNIRESNTGTPSWSHDGQTIAFDSLQKGNRDIYVINANGDRLRRLTTDPAEDTCPTWSQNGQWIYFGSTRSGSLQIWKMRVEDGQAVQVTKTGGFEGVEAPDGYFYYSKGRLIPGIWRIPVKGGEESPVLDHHRAGYWRYWVVTNKGIYFATAETRLHPIIEFFSFATGKITQIAQLEKPLSVGLRGLDISPDGRSILYTQMDQIGSDIMMMEDFR
jgi:Tol biopolymer transport system component/DNA-binding winged helix-turn-helix (wHTH) protein